MREKHVIYNSCLRRRGLTLVEVVASIALLGTMLTIIILAQGRHQRQIQRARTRIKACEAAEKLLTQWYVQNEDIPIDHTGQVSGDATFDWRTRTVDSHDVERIGATIVELSIWHATADRQGCLWQCDRLLGGFVSVRGR